MTNANASQIALNDVYHAFANTIFTSIIVAFVALCAFACYRIVLHELYLSQCRRDERARLSRAQRRVDRSTQRVRDIATRR